jgi:hypothetical protein
MNFSVVSILAQERRSLLLAPQILWLAVVAIVTALYFSTRHTERNSVDVPTVKFINPFLPDILSRLLFNSKAPTVIYRGYQKVFHITLRWIDRF